ncbi:MAG: class II glutamine amidotransferase, partial [Oscillospiraceae bacterium]
MCELFGASLKRKTDLKALLEEFYSHCVRHPHGWGLMTEENGKCRVVKEPVCASQSSLLKQELKKLTPQKNLLAHIRYATVGSRCAENAHPFTDYDNIGRQWVLMHNGTVYSDAEILKYMALQKGETDSERIFLYLLDNINQGIRQTGGSLSIEQRFRILNELVQRLSYRNKLNLMIFDGEVLYVHKNMHGTLYYHQSDNGYIFSTQPLGGGWKSFPLCRLIAFKDGEKILDGERHEGLFIPTLEYISAMDA